jgi:hypothetical protein
MKNRKSNDSCSILHQLPCNKNQEKREKKTIPLNGMHTFSTDFNAKEVWWKKKE